MPKKKKISNTTTTQGKLRIGDDWNAITIIALSQSNPLTVSYTHLTLPTKA